MTALLGYQALGSGGTVRFLGFIAFACIVSACAPAVDGNHANEVDDAVRDADSALNAADSALNAASATSQEIPLIPTQEETWDYSTTTDPMSDEKTELACIQSSNEIDLSAPYQATGARLCLRKSPQFGRDAYVSLNREGQILCHSYESCTIRVRFDTSSAETWSAVGPSDGSTDMVFIEDYSAFERRLRTANTTNVQLEFYQNGMQTFTFHTSGLKWRSSGK